MSAPMPGPEVFDVVIFGASGFTGKYVIREALKFLPPNASPLRTLALAGRSRERVAAALSWAASPGPVPDVPILVADTSDPASLAVVTARARVLLSCAGPFRLHGRQVAAACAEAGAHCLDISGEPEFMERVEADLHEVAAKNGSLIVSACGFASTVADLGFLFHSRQWTPPSAPVSVVAYVNLESSDRKIVGNFATFESAVLGVANTSQLQALRRSRPRPAKPSIPGPPPPKGSLMIEHDKALGLWAMKLPSADTVVVKRTLAKVAEHPEGLPCADETLDFEKHRKEFWSSIKPAHFGVKIGSRSILGLVWCLSTAIFVGILAGFSFGRSLLLKFPEFFSLGFFRKTGPTEAEVSNASFKTWFVGRGYIDSEHASECGSKPDKEIVTRVSGPEIGYITTSIVLVQCALILLSQRANLPKGGVYTPGIVFGPTDLQKRLEENGMSFDLISTRTIPSDEYAHAS
ncbi:probable mitochondrial saccharopine dehydrogenase-like oxidoreductase At5g39410 [Aegilops tauschii subsp. strangulata]|uniref:probable mitochondrial saccharopine dehydrogenase-like oxidoreductase At5g39410 n=1 Tax=Aegilops tauschii subsp. strangulata TaxID=200361 RepID=UPI00098A59C2|nr:probable mitochondrial saccharopine dehydrogenase-like oxidoreductase At5g39410 [Aegilops tauschii subsp. strangulata]